MFKKTFTFISILALSVFLVGCNHTENTSGLTKQEQKMVNQALSSTPTSVIESFMKATLGRIPNAEIDYDKARTLMTTSYAAEFDTPMFVPQAYGMQDGPTSVEVTDEEILTNTATVTVLGHWGPDNQMYWMFELKKQAGEWKLDFINPGQ